MSFFKSRQSTFHAKVQEELICGVCLDFLSEPKVLCCAHSFCCSCLQRLVAVKNKKREDLSLDLECPNCRQVTVLETGSVNELNTNHNLKRLVDIVSEEEKKRTRDVLKRRDSIHSSNQESKTVLCKVHNKKMEYFCIDCNDLICPKCIKSDHLAHRFEDVDDILPSMVTSLRNLIQPACEVRCMCRYMYKNGKYYNLGNTPLGFYLGLWNKLTEFLLAISWCTDIAEEVGQT